MKDYFYKTKAYLATLNLSSADILDRKANALLNDGKAYEKASQALRRRFVRGAREVTGIDRGGRTTRIKREKAGGKFKYFVEGQNGAWFEPDERIWAVAMYGLWQDSKE